MAQSSRDLNDCVVELREAAIKILEESKAALPQGDSVIVAQTYRNDRDQYECWKCGRDDEGNIVDKAAVKTYKKPGTSEHGHTDSAGNPASRAIDLLILRHGRIVDDGKDSSYTMLGVIGKQFGLEWSGDWANSFEAAHFQLPKAA